MTIRHTNSIICQLKVSLEYSDKTSCFELKLFQNEPKKLSLGDATVKQKKMATAYASGESPLSSSNGFKFGQEFTAVQLKMCQNTPLKVGSRRRVFIYYNLRK